MDKITAKQYFYLRILYSVGILRNTSFVFELEKCKMD